jgi:hypothetical protein
MHHAETQTIFTPAAADPSCISKLIGKSRGLALSVLIASVLGGTPAWAALGGTADSVQSDAVVLSGRLETRAGEGYSVQRLTLPTGTVVDEYASAAGTVFALTWRGAYPPELSQLLGSYFAEYQAAHAQPHPRRSHVQLDTADMVYRSGGHMRAFWGSAQVPTLVPAELKAEDFR